MIPFNTETKKKAIQLVNNIECPFCSGKQKCEVVHFSDVVTVYMESFGTRRPIQIKIPIAIHYFEKGYHMGKLWPTGKRQQIVLQKRARQDGDYVFEINVLIEQITRQ